MSRDAPGLTVSVGQNDVQLDVVEGIGIGFCRAVMPFGELMLGGRDLMRL